jgi:hypothetical protein
MVRRPDLMNFFTSDIPGNYVVVTAVLRQAVKNWEFCHSANSEITVCTFSGFHKLNGIIICYLCKFKSTKFMLKTLENFSCFSENFCPPRDCQSLLAPLYWRMCCDWYRPAVLFLLSHFIVTCVQTYSNLVSPIIPTYVVSNVVTWLY